MLHTSSSHSSRTPLLSRQELALIAVTMVWGGTFLVVHLAMQHSGPLFFVGLRFVTAGLIGLLVFRKAMAGLTRTELVAGIAIGAIVLLPFAGLMKEGLMRPYLLPDVGTIAMLAANTLAVAILSGTLSAAWTVGRVTNTQISEMLREDG